MDFRLRNTLFAVAAACIAVFIGFKLAEGSLFWPGVAVAVAGGAILVRLTALPLDVILCGWLIVGYIVGNRGFAQMMPAPGLPLLPAEAGLLVAGSWRLISSAFSRRLPFVRDPLNWAVLAWLVAGSARLLFDVPRFGFTAIRDFATVYYALFFFLAQEMARDRAAQRYLIGCAVAGAVFLAPMFALYTLFPTVFHVHLTVHGVPLIYYKGDLLYTYFAIGSLLLYFCLPGRWRHVAWLVSGGMFLFVAGGDNRASLAGLLFACLLLVLARRWRFPMWQGALAALGLMAIVGLAVIGQNAWAQRKLDGLGDRVRSVSDFQGLLAYQSEESFNKGDNNRYRLIWWRNVIEDTWAGNPALGLGFGADLASGFLQEYSPDLTDEFGVRSPHNIFLTVFGRMGGVGLLVWLAVCTCLARRGWRAVRHQEDPAGWALWCTLAVLLTSATFGVVLEGPMGAVPFWIIAGVAAARQRDHERAAEAAAADGTKPVADSAPGEKASAANEPAPAVIG